MKLPQVYVSITNDAIVDPSPATAQQHEEGTTAVCDAYKVLTIKIPPGMYKAMMRFYHGPTNKKAATNYLLGALTNKLEREAKSFPQTYPPHAPQASQTQDNALKKTGSAIMATNASYSEVK